MSAVVGEVLLEYIVPHIAEALVMVAARHAFGALARLPVPGDAHPAHPLPRRESPRCPIARSQLPGRLRLAVPGLAKDPAIAAPLLERTRSLPGIRDVTANPLTGNALVLYDPALISPSAILAAVTPTPAQ